MQFLKESDLHSLIDKDTLEDIIDGEVSLLTETEDRAITEMKSYLNGRYQVDQVFSGQDRNGLVVMYLSDITLFHLHSRISPDNIPELRSERYKNARDWLEKVADGFIDPLLPVKEEDENIPLRSGSGAKQEHYY